MKEATKLVRRPVNHNGMFQIAAYRQRFFQKRENIYPYCISSKYKLPQKRVIEYEYAGKGGKSQEIGSDDSRKLWISPN